MRMYKNKLKHLATYMANYTQVHTHTYICTHIHAHIIYHLCITYVHVSAYTKGEAGIPIWLDIFLGNSV